MEDTDKVHSHFHLVVAVEGRDRKKVVVVAGVVVFLSLFLVGWANE